MDGGPYVVGSCFQLFIHHFSWRLYIWNALRIPTDLIRRFIWISEFVWNTVVRVKVARLLFRKLYASLNKILWKMSNMMKIILTNETKNYNEWFLRCCFPVTTSWLPALNWLNRKILLTWSCHSRKCRIVVWFSALFFAFLDYFLSRALVFFH